MKSEFELLGRRYAVLPEHRMGGMDFRIGDAIHTVTARTLTNGEQVVTVDGKPHRVRIAASGSDIFVHAGGFAWTVTALDETQATGAGARSDRISAPMPGVVVSVAASKGAQVRAGETILVIESMKLETTIAAPHDAIIEDLPLQTGQSFDKGAMLVRFAAAADGGPGSSEE